MLETKQTLLPQQLFTELEPKAYQDFVKLLELSRVGIGNTLRVLTALHPDLYAQPFGLLRKHFACSVNDYGLLIPDFMKEVVEKRYRKDLPVTVNGDSFPSLNYNHLLRDSTTARGSADLVEYCVALHTSGEYRVRLTFNLIDSNGFAVPSCMFQSEEGQMIATTTSNNGCNSTTQVLAQLSGS
jgi:hypothetical protein